MKAFIKGLIYLIVAVVVVFVGGAYLMSPVAEIERATVIKAPPDKIYAIAGNLKRFNEWSPWAGLDPNASYSFEGPDQGVGQKMTWVSKDPNVGSGSMTVTEAVPGEKIVSTIDFGEMGQAVSTMKISPVNEGTAVIWGFRADVSGILERWASLMFEKTVGADYGKGLANLKILAEKEAGTGE